MAMKLSHLGVALGMLVTAACPQEVITSNGGLAIAGGGGATTDRLLFTVQPSNATAGNIITPAVVVTATDSLGNADTSFANNVVMTIAVNPVGGNLAGTTSVAAVRSVARFGDLSIDHSGQGYTLRATATGATTATSNSFNILSP